MMLIYYGSKARTNSGEGKSYMVEARPKVLKCPMGNKCCKQL